MPHDPILESRIETALFRAGATPEKKPVFGHLGFLVGERLACTVSGEEMHVRVGPIAYEAALEENRARPMSVAGKPMRGWVTLIAASAMEDEELKSWISRSLMFVRTLDQKDEDRPEEEDTGGLAIVRERIQPEEPDTDA